MGSDIAETLTAAIGGDDNALAALLAEFGPQVRARIAGTIPSRWQSVLDADDVLQTTYLEAFLRIRALVDQGPSAFAGWLTRVAENNLRDAIRELERLKRPQPTDRIQADRARDGADTVETLLDQLGCSSTTPSRCAAHGELKELLESALRALPADYAQVIRLYDLEGGPAADVATAMSRSPGAVFMLRARAHDRLRELLVPGSRFLSGSA